MTRGGFFHLHLHLLLLLGPARREILLGRFRCWLLLRTRNELAATLTNDPASSYARYSDRATTGDHCVPAQALISIFPMYILSSPYPPASEELQPQLLALFLSRLLARPRKNSPADSAMILSRCVSAGLCVYNANSRSGLQETKIVLVVPKRAAGEHSEG
ncbi:hypothetical protein KQX54_002635 [Cotesia glomerata]|uniref:Secreted protein n=1 Tax=Cotesia glomerata TaxID=32391 RepID=A0AAV7J4B4_COTGL|nr:hypothetical protein KQX54_002635 [Cotesia glomerata]